MTAIVRLNKQGLNDLIDNIKNSGNAPPELENIMAEINDDERTAAGETEGDVTEGPGGGANNGGTS
ncbi:hypothetical protein LCGC14_2273900 [marine sediment metagenome]|uniref:Uncharacterized protein n=1 Tax=marine sediment metagenome TaxID=412755 RepID=A0A0F9FR84_9ZZZZ